MTEHSKGTYIRMAQITKMYKVLHSDKVLTLPTHTYSNISPQSNFLPFTDNQYDIFLPFSCIDVMAFTCRFHISTSRHFSVTPETTTHIKHTHTRTFFVHITLTPNILLCFHILNLCHIPLRKPVLTEYCHNRLYTV